MTKQRTLPPRHLRVVDQIHRDLSELIRREVKDPRISAWVSLISIQNIELTADYAHAKIFFTVLNGDPKLTETILNEAAVHLHRCLFKKLHIHTVPALRFIYDTSIEHAFEMLQLIERANKIHVVDKEDE